MVETGRGEYRTAGHNENDQLDSGLGGWVSGVMLAGSPLKEYEIFLD